MNRLSSTRLRLAPSPPILISSTACDIWIPSAAFESAESFAGLGAELFGGPQDRLHDVLVTRAAAQVAGQAPAHFFLGWVRVGRQQCLGGHHHARRAEAALQAVLLPESL